MINRKWNKVCNSSHGRKLRVIKCNLECSGRQTDRKKATPDIQQPYDCSPFLRGQL